MNLLPTNKPKNTSVFAPKFLKILFRKLTRFPPIAESIPRIEEPTADAIIVQRIISFVFRLSARLESI